MMAPRTVAASRGWTWITEGFALFRKSPVNWFALILVLYASARLITAIPVLGVVFVLLMPVFLAGLMEGCRALEQGEALKLEHLLCGFRHNAAQLVTIGGVSLVGNLALPMILTAVGGDAMTAVMKAFQTGGAPASLSPEMRAAVSRTLLLGILLSVPLLMTLWFAPLLVYFADLGAIAALKTSFVACVKNLSAMLVYALVMLAAVYLMVFVLAMLRVPRFELALWMVAPLALPSLYASYKDLFTEGLTPEPASHTPA